MCVCVCVLCVLCCEYCNMCVVYYVSCIMHHVSTHAHTSPPLVLRTQVLVQNGDLVTGTLCKKSLGTSGGSLIHIIWLEHGPEAARAFLSQYQYLTNYWLLHHGFSLGIGDTVADPKTMNLINDIINKVGVGWGGGGWA